MSLFLSMPVFLLLVGPEKLLLIFNIGTDTVVSLFFFSLSPRNHFPIPAPWTQWDLEADYFAFLSHTNSPWTQILIE